MNIKHRRDELAIWASKEESFGMWHDINNSHPSDKITLTWREDDKLCTFWKHNKKDDGFIPSDLFFAGTIPLMDCTIEVDEKNKPGEKNGTLISYRVTVFSNYKKRVDNVPSQDAAIVGAISSEIIKGIHWIIPLVVLPGNPVIPMVTKLYVYAENNKPVHQFPYTLGDLADHQYGYLSTWYGIQIALLHPNIKEVFNHPKQELIYDRGRTNKGNTRRITRYIKKHKLTLEELEKSSQTNQAYIRKTLVWYVIGHWRNYSSGKAVFINGYWKGPLRNVEKNLDDTRLRIVQA